jgi:hypothetical protein
VRGSIAAADVDGDGNLDVLLGNLDVLLGNDGSPNRVLLRNDGSPGRVLLNAGDGTFPTSITRQRDHGFDRGGGLRRRPRRAACEGWQSFVRPRQPTSTYEAVACAAGSYASIALMPASPLALRALWWLLEWLRWWTRSHCNRWACLCIV